MNLGHFYFIKEDFFTRFTGMGLSENKSAGNRPCFYSFVDPKTQLYWMIPVSSKVEKYKDLHADRLQRFKKCENLVFGDLLGQERVFLIQNMFPTTIHYIENTYLQSGLPVGVDFNFSKDLISKAKKILMLQRKGYSLIRCKSLEIEKALLNIIIQ